MSEAQFSVTVMKARDCLRPGGALLARTASGRPMIVEVMDQHMLNGSRVQCPIAAS